MLKILRTTDLYLLAWLQICELNVPLLTILAIQTGLMLPSSIQLVA